MKKAQLLILTLLFLLVLTGCSGSRETYAPGALEFRSAEGGFYTVFPGAPEYHAEQVETMFGLLDTHMYMYNTEDASFLISYMDYPEESISPDSTGEYYDGAREAVLQGIEGGILEEEKDILHKQTPGREFRIVTPDKTVLTEKIFFAGNRLYQQVVVTKRHDVYKTEIENFFERFDIVKAE